MRASVHEDALCENRGDGAAGQKDSDLFVLKRWEMSRFNEEKSTNTSRSKKFRHTSDCSEPSHVQACPS